MTEQQEEPTLAEAQAADAGAPQTPAETPAEETPTEETATEPALYQEGTWHGLPNFKCPHCNFATPNKDGSAIVAKHIEGRHPDAWLEGV